MRISYWRSDVCSSDFLAACDILLLGRETAGVPDHVHAAADARLVIPIRPGLRSVNVATAAAMVLRSEEHTSELQSLMRISYAVFCLKKKKRTSITPKQLVHGLTKNHLL